MCAFDCAILVLVDASRKQLATSTSLKRANISMNEQLKVVGIHVNSKKLEDRVVLSSNWLRGLVVEDS